MKEKRVIVLLVFRIILWVTALSATVYWMYWSFQLYAMYENGIDEHTYATLLRPHFYPAVLIAIIAIGISVVLSVISDRIKKGKRHSEE